MSVSSKIDRLVLYKIKGPVIFSGHRNVCTVACCHRKELVEAQLGVHRP